MAELHDLTAWEQGAAILAGEISPVELARHYLDRAELLDAEVGAFATRTPELALAQAREAERALLDAVDTRDLSPLHGVCIPVKDLDLLAGVPCRLGSAAVDFTPDVDDVAVARMRAVHLVITGKTNTPEFGLPCYTEPDVAAPARTPWDLERSAGGSSGGAGAAVAAGLAAAALGSDGGGSIRIPASVCGLVGLKPSRGRVSNGPLGDQVGDLVVRGPLARTVRDAAALLDVVAGPAPGDPFIAPAPAHTFVEAAAHEPGSLRIARFATPILVDTEVHPDCLAAYERTSALLDELGHVVEDIPVPFPANVKDAFAPLWSVLSLGVPVRQEHEPLLRPLTRWLRERGRRVTGEQVATAIAAARRITRDAIAATAAYDVILTPTLAQPPALVGGLRNDADPGADFYAQTRFTPFTSPFNITGQPALTLPLHWSEEGLPIGVQFIGRPFGEATLLSLATQLEDARPWLGRRPSMW